MMVDRVKIVVAGINSFFCESGRLLQAIAIIVTPIVIWSSIERAIMIDYAEVRRDQEISVMLLQKELDIIEALQNLIIESTKEFQCAK
ncbi:hypothetical protein KAR91_68115 [Candidatus Pacearchaeota archaeon]|nr:hypothetical protein [Candidatus Pacearchaeota archaeon]